MSVRLVTGIPFALPSELKKFPIFYKALSLHIPKLAFLLFSPLFGFFLASCLS